MPTSCHPVDEFYGWKRAYSGIHDSTLGINSSPLHSDRLSSTGKWRESLPNLFREGAAHIVPSR